jgi:hypothetical protein
MKRIASALLLSLFIYNVAGYYFVFFVLNWQNNSEMTQVVSSSISLKTLRINKSELKNIVFKNGEKEIEYKGEMYDVKDQRVDGDAIVFHCLKDRKEKSLLANLDHNIRNNIDLRSSSNEKHPEKSAQKNMLKDYLFNMKEVTYYNSSQEIIFIPSDRLIGTYIVRLSAPPPKDILA